VAIIVPLTVFGIVWPAHLPAPRDREYDYDCHDSGACLTEASVPRPARPRRVKVVSVTSTSVTVTWRRTPSRRVVGYEVVLNGTRVAVVRQHRFTFAGLTCATAWRFTIRALGPNGRRSHRRTVFATTSACPPGTGPPPAPLVPPPPVPTPATAAPPAPAAPAPPPPGAIDRQAPTTPTGLSVGSIAPTAVALRWTAARDNVAVTGYRMLLNGVALTQGTTALSFTFTALTCGTRYTLGVLAFDAAGNASPAASRTGTTAACPPPAGSGTCPSNPKQGVQVPGALTVLDPANPCRTATGRVAAAHVEHDGDCHVNISVDPPYQGLLNAVNGSAALGQLITEVIPSHTLAIPAVGSRVSIFGSWVNDHSTGWNELHPVWTYTMLAGSTGVCGG
jgi:chitodextrinase